MSKDSPSSQVARSTVGILEQMIRSGELRQGALLPPQRVLAEQLNVSRSSLREALSVLEAVGMLRTRPRQGTHVSEPADGAEGHAPWRLGSLYTPAEVYQFRFVNEGYAARLAAMHATEEQLAMLRDNFRQLKEAVRNGELVTYSQRDFEFHRSIMAFTENRLFIDLYDRYSTVFQESQRLPLSWHRRLWEPVNEHENILQALEKRDGDSASYFMHVHIVRAAHRVGIVLNEVV
jgi:GntR family transcriptional repressor for pyruvate dehydrogenase complex